MRVVVDEKFHLVSKNCLRDLKKVPVLLPKRKIKKQKNQKQKKKTFLSKKMKRRRKENRNLTIRKTLKKNKATKIKIGRKKLMTNSLNLMEADQNGKIG